MNFNCRECFSFHFWLIHDLQLLTPHAFLVFSVTLTSISTTPDVELFRGDSKYSKEDRGAESTKAV